ncbi:MAG: potassium transporter Kup [Gemmatimonadaceae bacterium]
MTAAESSIIATPAAERPHIGPNPSSRKLAILSLAALGIVYGDIGTSPLYAIRECFNSESGVPRTPENVYGVLSLIVWALTLVVTGKYIFFILRADNRGEGGILALLALIHQRLMRQADSFKYGVLSALGLLGAALLYGEGVITPAITVMSAIEGLRVATPVFDRFVVPLSAMILFLLFVMQKHGTGRISRIFGPVMAIWFVSIAFFGTVEILRAPEILLAVNPWFGVRFFAQNGVIGFLVLGFVVLAVTGVEALYADMGHFGRRPIRIAWLFAVFPSLLLNYFGQGALLLRDPSAADNPFFRLVPSALLYPMVILATIAAVVASQALISGAFSLTRQAMQLGYSPRFTVTHTSKHEAGQIYIKEINTALMIGCIVLVVGFGSSSALAAAYGIAVTGTMTITTVLFHVVARQRWGWSNTKAIAFLLFFLSIDIPLLVANAVKFGDGGWFPLFVAALLFTMMTTWKRGRAVLQKLMHDASLPIELFLEDVRKRKPYRVPGTAVFMTSDPTGAPVVLLHHLKHNKIIHEQVLLLSVVTAEVPEVPATERASIDSLGEGFWRVTARYGFMQSPNVPEIMACCAAAGVQLRPAETSYFLGRERLIPTGPARLFRWRKKLFVFMSRNARSATEYFGIPPNRVVELGAQIEF